MYCFHGISNTHFTCSHIPPFPHLLITPSGNSDLFNKNPAPPPAGLPEPGTSQSLVTHAPTVDFPVVAAQDWILCIWLSPPSMSPGFNPVVADERTSFLSKPGNVPLRALMTASFARSPIHDFGGRFYFSLSSSLSRSHRQSVCQYSCC